jgi:hypothetical protein
MIVIPDLPELSFLKDRGESGFSIAEYANSTLKNLDMMKSPLRQTINLNEIIENDNSHFENINFTYDQQSNMLTPNNHETRAE